MRMTCALGGTEVDSESSWPDVLQSPWMLSVATAPHLRNSAGSNHCLVSEIYKNNSLLVAKGRQRFGVSLELSGQFNPFVWGPAVDPGLILCGSSEFSLTPQVNAQTC